MTPDPTPKIMLKNVFEKKKEFKIIFVTKCLKLIIDYY